ncbi:arylesterase [Nitrogeniibacter aestuarii]|uniref:arylesterase n=1 Tax=Nitrogeniibacter aestuarii TaxID=2815343 RepID=UPI001E4B5096|nr:arylesterase [Nitrogeniibacter aestuarii]
MTPRSMVRSIVVLLFILASPLVGAATILVLGDSLSAGYGLRAEQSWPAHLARRLEGIEGTHTVVNASVSGETTAGGRARLPHALETHQPDVVVIELGANDGLRGLPLERMKSNLEAMIDHSRRAGAQVVLVGMQLPPNYGPAYANKFRQTFETVASERNTAFVPFLLAGFADRREWFQPDGLHPTAEAQPAILDNVWPAIEPMVRAGVKLSER